MKTRSFLALLLLTALMVGGPAVPSSHAKFAGGHRAGSKPATPVRRATKFTSVYTNLGTQCRSVGTGGHGDDPSQRCTGYGGYVIVVDFSAASAHLRIEPKRNPTESNTVQLGAQPIDFDAGGKKVEWRFADGKPFAVIIRMEKAKEGDDPTAIWQPQNRLAPVLLVQGLGGYSGLNQEFDASKPTANADARKHADNAYQVGD